MNDPQMFQVGWEDKDTMSYPCLPVAFNLRRDRHGVIVDPTMSRATDLIGRIGQAAVGAGTDVVLIDAEHAVDETTTMELPALRTGTEIWRGLRRIREQVLDRHDGQRPQPASPGLLLMVHNVSAARRLAVLAAAGRLTARWWRIPAVGPNAAVDTCISDILTLGPSVGVHVLLSCRTLPPSLSVHLDNLITGFRLLMPGHADHDRRALVPAEQRAVHRQEKPLLIAGPTGHPTPVDLRRERPTRSVGDSWRDAA